MLRARWSTSRKPPNPISTRSRPSRPPPSRQVDSSLDWRLDPELSHRRYANWVRTSFADARHIVLKAEVGGDLVGFFIVERRSDGSVYWHLTAISPRWQGRGLGMSVWQTMLLRHRAEGATTVETTISGHNLAAINLYARLGFSFASGQMTFHRLRAPST